MALRTANNLKKLVALPVGVSDTTIQLTDTSGLPDVSDPNDYTMLTLIQAGTLLYEIVRVDSVSANVITVVRAQEGTVALNFSPSDEVRNWLTSGMFDKTVKAEATLNSNSLLVAGGDTDVSTPSTPTAVTHEGSLDLLGTAGEDTLLEIGKGRTGDGAAIVDLIGDPTNTDYGARLIRNKGVNGDTELFSKGVGKISLNSEDAGSIEFKTNDTPALIVDSNQNATFSGNVQVDGTLNTDGTAHIWNAVDHGVDNTGVADASAGISTLIDSMASGDTLYLPAGTYRFDTLVSKTGKGINITGAGINSTTINVNNTTGALYFTTTSTSNPENIDISGITFTTALAATYAIRLKGSNTPSERNSPRIKLHKLELLADNATGSYTQAIWLDDCIHVTLSDIHGKGYWTGTSASITSTAMILIGGNNSPVEFTINNCWCFFYEKAVDVNNTTEGVFISNCNFIAVDYGVDWNTSTAKPQLSVTNSHINAYINCINMTRAHQSVISGNLLYRREEATSTGDACIYMFDASDNIIHGNVFNDLNPTVGDSTAIELAGASNYNNITNNTIKEGIHNGLKCNISSLNNQAIDNDFSRAVDAAYTNSSPSLVICDNITDKRNVYAEMVIKGLSNGDRVLDFETDTGVADRNARIAALGGDTTTDSAELRLYGDSVTVEKGSSGVVPLAGLSGLNIEDNSDVGLGIFTPNTNIGSIAFGDPENASVGRIRYNHSNDSMLFNTNGGQAMSINSSQVVTFDNLINLTPVTAPSNPSSGFYIYVDSADGDLKCKSSTGVTTTLANN